MSGRRRLNTTARRRHTPEQILPKLREADRLLGEGADVAEVARHLEVSEQTYHRWRNQFGDMKAADVRRLKELERENRELRQIVTQRRASQIVSQHRSTQRYRPVKADPYRELRAQLRRFAKRHPRWGYRRTRAVPAR